MQTKRHGILNPKPLKSKWCGIFFFAEGVILGAEIQHGGALTAMSLFQNTEVNFNLFSVCNEHFVALFLERKKSVFEVLETVDNVKKSNIMNIEKQGGYYMVNSISKNENEILNEAVKEFATEGKITLKCPRCGNELVYEIFDSLEVVHCKDPHCIKSIRRGI